MSVPPYRKKDRLQHWQRSVGFVLPHLALAYVITEKQEYLDATRKWALAACGYPTWGLNDLDGLGLGAAQQLIGLAIVYDWCGDDLNAEDRKTIRDTIIRRGSGLFRAMVLEKGPTKHREYMGSHLWVRACSLALAGIAVFDEAGEASNWIGLAMKKFDRTMKALGPDGVSYEGLSYWSDGITSLLLFFDVAARYLDSDYRKHPWFRSTSYYFQYLALPRNSWSAENSVVDFGDSNRRVFHGPVTFQIPILSFFILSRFMI